MGSGMWLFWGSQSNPRPGQTELSLSGSESLQDEPVRTRYSLGQHAKLASEAGTGV